MLVFEKQSRIPCSAAALFHWHEAPDAFHKLMPPGEPVKVLHHDGAITNGARVLLRVGVWPLRFRWELQHQDYIAGEQFCDVQIRGPFVSYRHEHRMIALSEHVCMLSDRICFEMPWGFVGEWIGRWIMLPKLKRLFNYRHRVTAEAFL